MFVCNAADNQKSFHSHSYTGTEDIAQTAIIHLFFFFFKGFFLIRDRGLHGAMVTAFDGQGDSSCGLHRA